MQDNTKALLEALLFVSEKPLSPEQIKAVIDNLETTQIRALLSELMSEYEQSNRGIRIIEVAGGFQLRTPAALAPFVKKLFRNKHAQRLSRPALETLAIIAYKQPLTRSEIELIRNVNNDSLLHNLLEKNLIRITGRKKAPGRPFVFGTTRQFLEHFGLKSLDELPKIEEFKALNEKEKRDDENTKQSTQQD